MFRCVCARHGLEGTAGYPVQPASAWVVSVCSGRYPCLAHQPVGFVGVNMRYVVDAGLFKHPAGGSQCPLWACCG
eukprot:11512489-Prorocentrum_lima.AAC.1